MDKKTYHKGEERERVRRLIMEEGRRMFSTEPDMSMAKIAKKCGFKGANSLYRYFESKRELWFAIIIQDFTELTNILKSCIKVNPLDTLLEMSKMFIQFSMLEYSKFKVMFFTEPPPSSQAAGYYEKQHSPTAFTILMEQIELGIKSGEIPVQPAFALTTVLWSMLLGVSASLSPLYDYAKSDLGTTNRVDLTDTKVINEVEIFILNKIKLLLTS